MQSSRFLARGLLPRFFIGLVAAAALSACDDDDGHLPPVDAVADSFTLAAGQTGALLANDTFNGAGAVSGASGNVVFTLLTTPLPSGITVSGAGVVTVAASAVPGTTTLNYRICQSDDRGNCDEAAATIVVPAPTIVATDDSFTLAAGNSADVLTNDTLGGAQATSATVTANATGTLPTGITLSAGGIVAVAAGAPTGAHPVAYRICQIAAAANCATATATVTVPSSASLSGRAIDASTAAGVPDVRVSVGSVTATTDANGAFVLPGLTPADRVNVLFESNTHAGTVRIASVSATGTTDVQARLLPIRATANVDVAAGGTVTVSGSPAQVVLPPNAVQRVDGSVPTGAMRVRVTPIDPAIDTALMPGDFTTLVSGTPTPIESFGAMNVELADSDGARLQLRAGQSATIRIPMASRNTAPPATVPLFWFDNAAGRWVQEGTATLAGSGTNRYYEGTVTHFTTWNADQVMETVTLTGCVADANGVRVANATVFSDGIDYSGTSSALTDAGGSFTIAVRRASNATLAATSGGFLTNTLRTGPHAASTTLTDCLALGQTGAGITMKLTWGQAPSDLDSHLWTPSGTRVYYSARGSLTQAPFASLDVDDTSSYGPEVITITKLMVGTYKYYVHNYSGYSNGSFAASQARVELNIPGRSPQLFTPPATGETSSTNSWTLFELDVDPQCNITVRPVPAFSNSQPTGATSSTPVYCTAS